MRVSWNWKEGFRFALAEQFLSQNDAFLIYDKSPAERLGTFFVHPLYKAVNYISKHIQKPLAIALFTLLAALCAIVVFYNLPAIAILGKLFPPKAIRCLLFLYIEVNLLGMGCRAIGRFNNKTLIELWKEGKLIPVFPGDKRYK